jgi:hypothetical protein
MTTIKLLIEIEANGNYCATRCPWLDGTGFCVCFDSVRLAMSGDELLRCEACIEAEHDANAPGMREDKERRDHETKMLARDLFIRHVTESRDSVGDTAINCIQWAERFLRTWEIRDGETNEVQHAVGIRNNLTCKDCEHFLHAKDVERCSEWNIMKPPASCLSFTPKGTLGVKLPGENK